MAVKPFATNYLVADHDMYKEFMDNRFEYMKKNNLETDILFCNTNKKDGNGKSASFLPNGKTTVDDQNSYAAICKWHCITISYNIWSELVKDCVKEDSRVTIYKKFVNVPVDVLKKFKYRVEKSIENARCDYNKRLNGGHGGNLNACRYLVMFWTYLDLKKDCKTQRYFPDLETIQRAAKVFGYTDKENPFEMNGRFTKRAERKVSEEKPMEQTEQTEQTEKTNDVNTLLVDIIDDRRLTNPLYRAGIQTVGDFLAKSDKELLKIRTFGVVKLKKVREVIDKYVKKPKEESVIDIAEQAAKEVEEERKGLDISVHKFKGDPYLHVDVDNRKRINELNEKLEKAKNDYNALLEKYNNLKDDYDKLDATRDALLRNNHDLVSYNTSLRVEIENLKNNIAELRSRETKLNIAANPKNLDTLTLLNTVLEKMKESKMEYILLTIDGMVIDIHPKQNSTIRMREAGYGRV